MLEPDDLFLVLVHIFLHETAVKVVHFSCSILIV